MVTRALEFLCPKNAESEGADYFGRQIAGRSGIQDRDCVGKTDLSYSTFVPLAQRAARSNSSLFASVGGGPDYGVRLPLERTRRGFFKQSGP